MKTNRKFIAAILTLVLSLSAQTVFASYEVNEQEPNNRATSGQKIYNYNTVVTGYISSPIDRDFYKINQ